MTFSDSLKKPTVVFVVSFIIAMAFIVWGVIPGSNLDAITKAVHKLILAKFGWFYLLSTSAFLLFALVLIFTKYGDIKLGKDHDKPEFSTGTWFAMLFSAGMGIGLVFWGVAEPMYHFNGPPVGEAGSAEGARVALRYSFFHWGLHAWGIFTVTGLALAYYGFRKGYPGTIAQVFRPLIGDRVDGPIGHAINILAVFATIFGIATSLGFGASQISGGISHLSGGSLENGTSLKLWVILGITALYMISAQTGIQKGIRYLSLVNMCLALTLAAFVLFTGPTNFIMDVFTQTLGAYLQNIPSMSLTLNPFEQTNWAQSWTIFYWAWWIAWAPFVGMFIARISKGRTIREFLVCVLVVPTLVGALWISIFGGTAIHMDMFDNANIYGVIKEQGTEMALFAVLANLPWTEMASALAIVLVATFFVTSADSATFVLGMQTTDGNMEPPNSVKTVWGLVQSGAAAVLLLTGGLGALQTASIIAALPFTFVMIGMVFALWKSLKEEAIASPTPVTPAEESA